MTRRMMLWLSAIAALAVLVAYQVVVSSVGERDREFMARADVPTLQPGGQRVDGMPLTVFEVPA